MVKDLVSNELNIGDNCYCINGENGQWVKVALVEIEYFSLVLLIACFIMIVNLILAII